MFRIESVCGARHTTTANASRAAVPCAAVQAHSGWLARRFRLLWTSGGAPSGAEAIRTGPDGACNPGLRVPRICSGRVSPREAACVTGAALSAGCETSRGSCP